MSKLRYVVMNTQEARPLLAPYCINYMTKACVVDKQTGEVMALCPNDATAWTICQALNVTEGIPR